MSSPAKIIFIDDLIREHYPYLFRLASTLLDDQDDADDATQETFIRAAAHLTEFRGEAEIKTWLSAIAVNVCRGELRKRKSRSILKRTMQVIQSRGGKLADPEEQAAQNDLHERLRKAIASLDEKHRLPVLLHYIQHQSVSQIASILDTNENTIHARLFHARRKLYMRLRDVVQQPSPNSHDRED